MRRFQLDINLFYLSGDNRPIKLNVYNDSNNIWETICAGFSKLISELEDAGGMQLPSFGRKDSRWEWPDGMDSPYKKRDGQVGCVESIEPCNIEVSVQCCSCGTPMGSQDNFCPNCGIKIKK